MKLEVIATAIVGAIVTIFGVFFNKKKSTAEARKIDADAEAIELTNEKQIGEYWKTFSNDLVKEIELLKRQMKVLQIRNNELELRLLAVEKN